MHRIQEFLAQKRFAFVGVSRKPQDFSRAVFREFRNRGYEPVPVHPHANEIDGLKCYPRFEDIQPPVDSLLLMTSPSVTGVIVRQAAAAGVKRIWMHRGGGAGAVNPEAVQFCEANGITVIPGQCPLMFLSHPGWIHRVHAFFRKLTGSYPKEDCRAVPS